MSGPGEMRHLLSSRNLARMPDMLWNETAKTRFARPRARFGSDFKDEEWVLVGPRLPPLGKRGSPARPTFGRGPTRSNACSTTDASGARFTVVFPRLRRFSTISMRGAATGSATG